MEICQTAVGPGGYTYLFYFRSGRCINSTIMERKLSIDWDDLQIFLAVLRSGSLRGAARKLHLNHATVNRRLRALEAGFGSKLFDRTRDGFFPTQAGEDLLDSAERVEDELSNPPLSRLGRWICCLCSSSKLRPRRSRISAVSSIRKVH